MAKQKQYPLLDRLESLLQDTSMPEIIEALLKLSHKYAAQLRRERNSEYQAWEGIEDALKNALEEIGGVD
jgi:hypothetical protein